MHHSPTAQQRPAQNTVILDERGQPIADHNGPVAPGQSVRVSMLMMDNMTPVTATERHALVHARLGAASVGKSADFLDAAYRVLVGDTSAVSAPAPVQIRLTDAQRAFSQRGIERALADRATRQQTALTDARQSAHAEYVASLSSSWATNDSQRTMATNEAMRQGGAPLPSAPMADAAKSADIRRGAYDAYRAGLADAWKGAA